MTYEELYNGLIGYIKERRNRIINTYGRLSDKEVELQGMLGAIAELTGEDLAALEEVDKNLYYVVGKVL